MEAEMQPPMHPPTPTLDSSPQVSPAGPAIKRRAPIACRRCRRMRSKCIHDKGNPPSPPCQACFEAGLGKEDCVFPVRGQPDNDREYRHPRVRAEKMNKRDPNKVRREILDAPTVYSPAPLGPKLVTGVDEWDFLPPVPEIIDSVQMFTRHYFQLGFIPKQVFPERLRQNPHSYSTFLLMGILSISARFTPSLVERYGDGMKASDMFMERASAVALSELYQDPTLERCQAFYLLSIAQQGSGFRNRSYINLGIAMRMAALMRLHREESYHLPNPTKDLIMQAESARRTLWMLHSQDNLHSGPSSPVSLAASDITALLPGNEEDFAQGVEPQSRAALEGTPPAIEHPNLIYDPHRSLFATLIQTHHLWGSISRRAVRHDKCSRPWDSKSDFAKMEKKLKDWEASLPHDHTWSPTLLKGFKHDGEDLAYLAVTMVTRLCNIVLRKAYLNNIIHPDASDPQIPGFWSNISKDLFTNVRQLFNQIDTQFKERSEEEGIGAQMAAFCVYSCGIMATYLCKYPNICPDPSIAREGPMMLDRTIKILGESQAIWPLASRWLDRLQRFVSDKKNIIAGYEGSMADGRDPIPQALHPSLSHSPVKPGPPQTPLDDKRRLARQNSQGQRHPSTSSGSNTSILPPPQPVPTPDMFIDPSIRLPAPQPHQSQIQPQPSQGEIVPHSQNPHSQVSNVGRNGANSLDLLVAAFDTQRGGTNMPPPGAPYDPAGQGTQEYYGQPHLATNDGYENELQYYIDGAPNMQNPVWGGGMYGY